jgi:hypothetical protein
MPYIIKPVNNGYKVCKKDDPNKCFSNKPLTEEKAKKQEKAIILSELEGGALTHRLNFIKKNKLEDIPYSLEELSNISNIPLEILQEIYNRGIGAYKTNLKSVRLKGSYIKNVDAPPSQKLSKENWAFARVYSFINTYKSNKLKHDIDLKEKLKGGNLNYMDIDNDLYLTIAKERAKKNGYDPKLLEWADDEKHKLKYNGVKFGRKGYNDFIIYAIKAHNKEITKEEALKHRKNYLARASKIKGNWKDNKESPNNLAMSILW